jgi:hypothetical protein
MSYQILKLVVCILLRVLVQVQSFRLTQHCFALDSVALDGNPEPVLSNINVVLTC